MATTRIIAMHRSKGKSIAACLKARTDYAKNPDKTDGGALVSAYECDPRIVDSQFAFSKREYRAITGREQARDVIAYQVRQSFRPGEILPEEANRIGYEFASRFLKGDHAFIVATHVDKKHIHNHIIWNSTALDCTRKWRDFKRSAFAVRQLSDAICIENGLSFVEHPKGKSAHYGKWLGNRVEISHRERIRITIDDALLKKPTDILELLGLLKASGYEIKPGKRPSLRGKGQQRFIRLDSLGEGYTVADLQSVLDGKRTHEPRKENPYDKTEKPLRLLVDIEAALEAGKGAGYERWAKVFNLKQMAQTVNYLSANALLDYDTLKEKTNTARINFDMLSGQIKDVEHRLSEASSLRQHILQYIKTRDVYADYRKNGYSKVFLSAHESDILLHKAAKKAFDELGIRKLPTMKQLNSECADLAFEKKKLYADYKKVKAEMNELLTALRNVDTLLTSSPSLDKKARDNQQR